jgi:hypothetical protein
MIPAMVVIPETLGLAALNRVNSETSTVPEPRHG